MNDDPRIMRVQCKSCGLITAPPVRAIVDGYECSHCQGGQFSTYSETLVCDFCCDASERVTMAYPARDFEIPMPEGAAMSSNSDGWWAACGTCSRLIERGKRDELAQRSAQVFNRKNPDMRNHSLLGQIRHFHDLFWTNRTGPGIPEPDTQEDPE